MNSFGRLFRVMIFGESHGEYVGCTIDGVPSGIKINQQIFSEDLQRRKPGKKGTTKRVELDNPLIISGVFNGFSTGAPLTIIFKNQNIRSSDYTVFKDIPRPSHADFTASKKYFGFNDYRGGGMFSGRLTLPLVAAGVIAKKIIAPIEVKAEIVEIFGKKNNFEQVIQQAAQKGDSVGGIVACRAINMPIGLGEPFFDSLESYISHLVFAIPGVKAIEFGAGFEATKMYGSQFNDRIIDDKGTTATNNSGGINGGISNGNDLFFRIAVRPTASISKPQKTFNFKTKRITDLKIKGRHDVAIVLRVPVVLEAAVSIALADLLLIRKSQM